MFGLDVLSVTRNKIEVGNRKKTVIHYKVHYHHHCWQLHLYFVCILLVGQGGVSCDDGCGGCFNINAPSLSPSLPLKYLSTTSNPHFVVAYKRHLQALYSHPLTHRSRINIMIHHHSGSWWVNVQTSRNQHKAAPSDRIIKPRSRNAMDTHSLTCNNPNVTQKSPKS